MCTVYSVEYTVVDVYSVQCISSKICFDVYTVQCTRVHLAPSVVEVYTVHSLQLPPSDVDVYNVQCTVYN